MGLEGYFLEAMVLMVLSCNTGWVGRDWHKRQCDLASWPNRCHLSKVPLSKAGTKQPWALGELLNVGAHGSWAKLR